ncbi:MAG: hypothetical protein VKK04_26485 [Synechococcales bacterium]|nr:hypothetical protein [Synechococcales bacterium]
MSTFPKHREQANASPNASPQVNPAKGSLHRPNPAKKGIWFLGSATLGVGIIDRSVATLMDGTLSWFDVLQVAITVFFFGCWILLKPSQGSGGL